MHDALPHRRCPACQSEMDPLQVRGVTIDGCTNCNGFWFDTDELGALADRDIVESVVGHAMRSGYRCHCKKCHDELNDSPTVTECFKCGQAVPKCPRCGDVTLSIGNFQGVNLDVCPCCHGIFFDAGELQLLLRGQGSATYVAQDALNRARAQRLDDNRTARRYGIAFGDEADLTEQDGPHRAYRCAVCQKRVKYRHVFIDGSEHRCGSCASPTASPLYMHPVDKMGHFEREMQPYLYRGRRGSEGISVDEYNYYGHQRIRNMHFFSEVIVDFFNFLFAKKR